MSDLKLDENRDLLVSDNQIYLTAEGTESIAQRLGIRLRFFYREWILDRSEGTKWFETVLKKNADQFLVDQELRKRVLNTPQIKSIESWDSTLDRSLREYSVTATVRTTLGERITFGFSDELNTPVG